MKEEKEALEKDLLLGTALTTSWVPSQVKEKLVSHCNTCYLEAH